MFVVVDLHKRTTIAFEAVWVIKACPWFDFRFQHRQHHHCPQLLRRFTEGSSACVAVSFKRSAEVVPRVEDPETESGGTEDSCVDKCPFEDGFP